MMERLEAKLEASSFITYFSDFKGDERSVYIVKEYIYIYRRFMDKDYSLCKRQTEVIFTSFVHESSIAGRQVISTPLKILPEGGILI